MNPRIGLITPVKEGLGNWMGGFYAQFQPDTAANAEWAARGTAKAMAWAPARMVDAVEDMLSAWRNNDNSGKAGTSAYIPVLFLAVAGEYDETPSEAGRSLTDRLPFTFPEDSHHREFMVRIMSVDLRAQAVVVASDPLTAMSMVGQLSEWAKQKPTFGAAYSFAGFTHDWPVRIIAADRMAIPNPVGDQFTVLAVDITVRAGMPMFFGPVGTDATDGQGTPGNALNPPGFAITSGILSGHKPAITRPAGVSKAAWEAFIRITGARGPTGGAASVVLHGVVDETEA